MAATKSKCLEAIKGTGGNISRIIAKLGIQRRQFYNLRQKWPEVQDALEDEYERLLDDAEDTLQDHISDGHVAANIFFLKTKGRVRGYNEHHSVDVTTKGESLNRKWEVVDPAPDTNQDDDD